MKDTLVYHFGVKASTVFGATLTKSINKKFSTDVYYYYYYYYFFYYWIPEQLGFLQSTARTERFRLRQNKSVVNTSKDLREIKVDDVSCDDFNSFSRKVVVVNLYSCYFLFFPIIMLLSPLDYISRLRVQLCLVQFVCVMLVTPWTLALR